MVYPNPNAKITRGANFNFFGEATISLTDFGDADGDANMLVGVRGPSLSFFIKNTGSNTLEYSFNGTDLAGRLITNTERFFPFRRISKIWFRSVGGATDVEVEAWATS